MMYLRAEQYEQITRQLRSELAGGRNSERRTSPRAGLRGQVRIIPCRTNAQTESFTAWVRDISAEGMGFLFPQAVDPGTYLVATLPTNSAATLDLLFVCVRCETVGDGQFSVGARFERVITAEDINPTR
jgi:c-di-GMP-binding flagellar brake protein YcgR